MKVCFYNVTASFIPGGLETYCWEVARELVRKGHDVTIMAGDKGRARYPEVRLLVYPFRIEQSWPDLGTRFRRLMERLSFARHSIAALVGGRYDAVIVNKPFDFPILWEARRRGMASRTMFRSGGTDFFAGDRLFAGAIDIWASASQYNASQVMARYGHPTEVIHNGVDTSRFTPAQARASSTFTLVSVGRLVGWKGHRIVIQALQGLPEAVRYVIVGEGTERDALEALARSIGLGDRVRFAGRVDHEALPELLRQADVLAQPSIGEEAFGISVVEGMACGLPALVSDQGGLPEIVEEERCGLRLRAGDVAAWRTAIQALASDPARVRRMGEAARKRALTHFTWARNAARHEALLGGSG
ncbi:MAG TPA: glycosyltransferase family 4 protein [Burkholderiales bacterium]